MPQRSTRAGLILVGSEIALICDTLDWAAETTVAPTESYIDALRSLFPTSPEDLANTARSVSDISYASEPLVPIRHVTQGPGSPLRAPRGARYPSEGRQSSRA